MYITFEMMLKEGYQRCLEMWHARVLRSVKQVADTSAYLVYQLCIQKCHFIPLCDAVLLGNQLQINITLEEMEKEDIITFI